jgi:hypothetical protein
MEIKRVGSQQTSEGPVDWFTGSVRIEPVFEAPEPARVRGPSVMSGLLGFRVKTVRSRKDESYEKNQLGAKQQTNDSQRAVGPAVAVLAKERKHAHKGDEVGTEKSAARHLPSSASFLTSCRESGRTTPGSDR